jgi:hypothetical protein
MTVFLTVSLLLNILGCSVCKGFKLWFEPVSTTNKADTHADNQVL